MDIYFAKATYLNNIYKISDFFSGSTYVQNANKKLSVNLTADDGFTSVVCPSDQLPDDTYIREYTHIMIPSMTKIYEITSFQYVNGSQVRLSLTEDALIGNYEELKTKKIMLNRSNDTSRFLGLNDIKDVAIKHTASVTYGDVPANWTGYWAMFTFQADAGEVEFEFGDVNNTSSVGILNYASYADLVTAFPEHTTTTPFIYDYYLKFAIASSTRHQCIYYDGQLKWVQVRTSRNIDIYTSGGSLSSTRDDAVAWETSRIAMTGDLGTLNVLLPLDTSLVQMTTFSNGTFPVPMPSFYHYKSNSQPDKLLNVRIIPAALIEPFTISIDVRPLIRRIDNVSGTSFSGTVTTGSYYTKAISSPSVRLNQEGPYAINLPSEQGGWTLPIFTALQLTSIFTFAQPGITYPTDYEPFKRYFLSFYGSLIPIPARYASSFNVRLGITSDSALFEVYTDRYNIIGSGDLKWFTKFAVDLLALYQANNPTYKEQFWTGQISSAIRSVGGGAVGGFVAGGPVGAAAGLGAGAANALMSTVTGSLNMHWMEKGLKDNADQIQGINEIALAFLKGFSAYIITVVPESEAVSQMKSSLELVGFPASSSATIATLTAFNVASLGLGASKLIVGKLLETVKNSSVTRMIDTKLMEGVIII